MKTIERPTTKHHSSPHISLRLPAKDQPAIRVPTIPPIPTIERLPERTSDAPARPPFVRWLGLLALVLMIASGATILSVMLDDETTGYGETPWTTESRGLVYGLDVGIVEAPWTPASRSLAVPTEAPWTAEVRGILPTAPAPDAVPWTPATRGLTVPADTPWTLESRGLTPVVELPTVDGPWTAGSRGLTES